MQPQPQASSWVFKYLVAGNKVQSLFAATEGLVRKVTKFKFNSNFNDRSSYLRKKNEFNIYTQTTDVEICNFHSLSFDN